MDRLPMSVSAGMSDRHDDTIGNVLGYYTMKYPTGFITILLALLLQGCGTPEPARPENGALLPAGAGVPAKDARIVPHPWPATRVSREEACSIAASYHEKEWPGAGKPRCVALLTEEGQRLIWTVGCSAGNVKTAGTTTTIYVTADDGEVLGVLQRKTPVR
jgi:hypothetical protein